MTKQVKICDRCKKETKILHNIYDGVLSSKYITLVSTKCEKCSNQGSQKCSTCARLPEFEVCESCMKEFDDFIVNFTGEN